MTDFNSQTGLGVTAMVDGRGVAVGNAAQMSSVGADPSGIIAMVLVSC